MITERDRFLVFMSLCEIANKKQEFLLDMLDDFSIEKMLKNSEVEKLFSAEEFHRMILNYDGRTLDSSIENMQRNGIKILTIFSEDYPEKLINLPDRPLILYAKGDLSLLNKQGFAIVGTRSPSSYGKMITEKFAGELAESGLVIVSGLCYGVDEIAHRKTLEVGGKTIAVVGSGFKYIYPAVNTQLSEDIAEKGLLLSEYYPSYKSRKYSFAKRNRIVAGLSDGVLITEASFKSGTVHTKEYASEYGNDLFAVPGNVTSTKSELTNMMIKTSQAECVISPEDIIKYYGLEKKQIQKKAIELNFDQQAILNLLEDGEKSFDFLLENSKLSTKSLNFCLTILEVNGLIKKLPAQFYALIK